MKKVLHAKKFSDEILQEAGLLTERKGEFFRDRITFPIRNASGQIIGFSARKYKEETYGGKYINTSETPLFKKSRILFGLNYSRRRIAKERRAIIVEGQIDCLRLIEAGLNLTVAALGTAFGEGHVRELEQLGVRNVVLVFDPDEAGQAATSKVGNLFQKVGIDVSVVTLPEKCDPDLFLNRFGIDAFADTLISGSDYLTFQVNYLSKELNAESPAGKTVLVSTLTSQIKGWDQPLMIHESLKKVATLTHIPEEMVGLSSLPRSLPIASRSFVPPSPMDVDPHRVLELDLLRWLFMMAGEKPHFVECAEKYLTAEHFWIPTCRILYQAFLNAFRQGLPHDLLSLFIEIHNEEVQGYIDEIQHKKVNRERAELLFLETIQKLLDRQWLQSREEVRQEIHSGAHTPEEVLALAKKFDDLKKERPVITKENLHGSFDR